MPKDKKKKKRSLEIRNFMCRVDDNYRFASIDWSQVKLGNNVRYALVCCHTTGKNGRPHYHIYLETSRTRTIKWVHDWLKVPKVGVSNCIQPAYNVEKSINYVRDPEKNLGEIQEFGEMVSQGERTDFTQAIKLIEETPTYYDLIRNPDLEPKLMRNLTWCKEIFNTRKIRLDDPPEITILPWEQEILDFLSLPVDRRLILWVYGPGGCGKSTFIEYLESVYEYIQVFSSKDDYVYCNYKPTTQICVFDYPADADPNSIALRAMEKIKDGRIPDTLFGKPGYRIKRPHVIVFWNFKPANAWFSSGRVQQLDIVNYKKQ